MPVLLFSDSGNRLPLFNPFAAALASLGRAERYEAEFMGLQVLRNVYCRAYLAM